MREKLRIGVLLGFLAISPLAIADAPNAPEAIAAKPAASSASSRILSEFKFSAVPDITAEQVTPTSSLLSEDFGEILSMPKFFVVARHNLPAEKELLTDYGQIQLAKSRFTTPLYRVTFGPLSQMAAYYFNFLTIFQGWHPNDAEAMALYRESERVQILSDFDDLSRLEKLGDPRSADDLDNMRQRVLQTGLDSLYWNPTGPTGILIGRRNR